MNGVQIGDDISAIVVDIGSHTIKAGYAGDDTPQCVIPSDVGIVFQEGNDNEVGSSRMDLESDGPSSNTSNSKLKYYCGIDGLNYPRENMDIRSPVQNGLISDWDGIQNLMQHLFDRELRIAPNEHPILFSEPSFNTPQLREKLTELMFEQFDAPALFISKSAVLSSFASGRSTSLVLESGGGFTAATPVHDGYVLTKSLVSSNLAGIELTKLYARILESEGVTPRPLFSITKVQNKDNEIVVKDKNLPNITKSFYNYHSLRVVQDLKETLCRVSDFPLEKDDPYNNLSPEYYPLPDNTSLPVGVSRFKVPESLFEPKIIPDNMGIDTTNLLGIHQMMFNSVSSCDVDIRKELFLNIVFSGGTTLIPGFQERLQRELSTKAPQQMKMKFVIPPLGLEKKYSVFIGGSILGSLGTFHQMWMSKTEYEEYGKSLVERKCP